MLIEFRVRNFRSLRDEQVLSLVAAKDKTLEDTNTIETGLKAAPRLVRSAVVYGPNAGGKSNLLKALQWMQWFVLGSAQLKPEQPLEVSPFRMDAASGQQPTCFEVTFVRSGIRYQYGFEVTNLRVVREYLLVYKTAKPQKWYERNFDSATDQERYEFGSALAGQKTVWKEATRPNSLFLSIAVMLNGIELKPVYEWFSLCLRVINDNSPLSLDYTLSALAIDNNRNLICHFLSTADISISDVNVVTEKVAGVPFFGVDPTTGQFVFRSDEREVKQLRLVHRSDTSQAEFALGDESTGTQRMLCIAGPILSVLKEGMTFFVDELDTSLHPLLVRRLVNMFHSTSLNQKGAQLVFCTHDSSLLDGDLFRRDQIWFVEKDREQASKLYPLTDFSPRKNEALERGYLMGRYGALPFFRDWSL